MIWYFFEDTENRLRDTETSLRETESNLRDAETRLDSAQRQNDKLRDQLAGTVQTYQNYEITKEKIADFFYLIFTLFKFMQLTYSFMQQIKWIQRVDAFHPFIWG